MYRIAILGVGGVGGFFGGKLAANFADSEDVEVILIARGEKRQTIESNGLRVITTQEEFVTKPHLITDDPDQIGEVDLFLICTKAYDLAESIKKYKDCIGEKTAILPLLNGVDHAETIRAVLPNAEVWKGCVFIVARLVEAGIVKVDSEIKLLQFGSLDGTTKKLEKFEMILKESGINGELSTDIDKTIWDKFIFISSLATLTSYLDVNIGGVINSPENEKLLAELIGEVTQLARAKNIKVADDIEEFTLNRIKTAPPDSTTSMHSDFIKKGQTELESLTGFVVNDSKKMNLAIPFYEKFYNELKTR